MKAYKIVLICCAVIVGISGITAIFGNHVIGERTANVNTIALCFFIFLEVFRK